MSSNMRFRAWNIGSLDTSYTYDIQEQRNLFDWFKDSTKIIEQYTGIRDKTGREIYENDIIEDNGNEYIVEFNNGAFCYFDEQGARHLLESEKIKVVGNVHTKNNIGEENE